MKAGIFGKFLLRNTFFLADRSEVLSEQRQNIGHANPRAFSDSRIKVVDVNLGNAYYRRGDLGKAILNYERAGRLAPRDGDIQANLTYAYEKSLDQYEVEANSPLEQWTQAASSKLTLNEMSVLALVIFWVLIILFILYRHSRSSGFKKGLRYALVFTLFIFAISVITLGGRIYTESTSPDAIVTVENVDVISNPGDGGVTQFTLHSGAHVVLLETRGQWVLLSLPGDQFQGWVPVESVEGIGF